MTETYYTFGIMLALGCVFAVITLLYVIWRAFSGKGGEIGGWEWRGAGRRIFAVARTTVAEGIRAKVASGFALTILIAIPLFWLTGDGDGTIKGKIQMFLAYSMGFTGFILALLTIFFSCRSLSVEIAQRQIYAIVTKPIPRWQILAGKWVGVMALNVSLLGIATLATYVGTRASLYQFKRQLKHELQTYGSMKPEQAGSVVAALDRVKGVGKTGAESPVVTAFMESIGWSRQQTVDMLLRLPEPTRVNLRRFDELRRQVLVARASIKPPRPDLSVAVDKLYAQLKEDDRLPRDWSRGRVMDQLRNELATTESTVLPGYGRQWILEGPVPEEGDDFIMSLRFKVRPSRVLDSVIVMGRTLGADKLLCIWGVGNPSTAKYVEQMETYPVETMNEIEIPVDAVEADGKIYVNFKNIDPRRVDAIFGAADQDLEVLYRVGSFELGLLQAALGLLIPVACLACFGILASTFLSLPVGSLILVTLFIVSSSTGFIAESLAVTSEYIDPSRDPGFAWKARKLIVDAIDVLLSIGDTDPVSSLIEGKTIDWSVPWQAGVASVLRSWPFALMKGFLFLGIGVWVFRRRELAAVIV